MKKEKKTTKKKYAKPLLRVVNISPGMQTLGIGCKMFVDSNFSPIPDIPPQAKIIHFHSRTQPSLWNSGSVP